MKQAKAGGGALTLNFCFYKPDKSNILLIQKQKHISDVEADEGRWRQGKPGGGVSILNFRFYKPDKPKTM